MTLLICLRSASSKTRLGPESRRRLQEQRWWVPFHTSGWKNDLRDGAIAIAD